MSDSCLDSGPNIALSMVGSPPALHAEPVFSADPEQGLVVSDNGDGIWAPRRPPLIVPPLGPGQDGWERYVGVGNNEGDQTRMWGFVYANGQWNFVGGPDLVTVDETGGSFGHDSNAAWHALGNTINITVPMSLTYIISWGGAVSAGEDGHATLLGLSIGGANPASDDVCQTGTAQTVTVSRSTTKQVASGAAINLKGKSASTSGTSVFNHLWVRMQPVHA